MMKQLPRISGLLYGTPWAITLSQHAELSRLYQNYLRGAYIPPQAISQEGETQGGIEWEFNRESGIAVIRLQGVVVKRAPDMECGPRVIDLSGLDAILDEIASDEAAQTIVFDFDSPGGQMTGLPETSERIRELAMMGRRIIAYTDTEMCSAAYWIAAAADEIYAARSSKIGSIGVYAAGIDDSRSWEMDGLELILAKSGELKAMGHPGKPWSDAEKQFLQGLVAKAGGDFKAWITERRPGIDPGAMEGQFFIAGDAPFGMVDGYYRDLPALLADLMP